ncbi:DUF2298 domain-containing protein [Roseibaca sp. V10]|uniref:DUF2298 domain-containing protein n=1 Tax=Roseinatronobacter domitianus TaxID=2940293 RepID=A0ABT0LWY1_9RHOB|nr:DUF2298 domain-containing protein [Roseibaca domitiana]MCL1627111.1 DUF2298 domain-containing protein [Roseibaca domitiana]
MADILLVLRLFAVMALATFIARPLALRLVPWGGGWIAALLLSWLVLGWVPWVLAALRLVPFAQASLSGLLVLLALRFALGAPANGRIKGRISERAGGALPLLLGAAGLFWLGLAQRLEKASLSGLEKFTNMAFVSSAMRSDVMPPADPWFAGEPVNYYYVGQAMVAALGNLLGARADQVYQLAMAVLFALTGLAVWAITLRLARPAGIWTARVMAGFAAAIVLYGGNLHSALYTLLRPLMPATNPAFYFPDSTRFIGFDPPTQDKAFTEFPAYAFAVGDLHAHVLALPVFFLALMVLLAMVAATRRGAAPSTSQALGFGWLMGLSASINSWDVAVLGLAALVVAAILLSQSRRGGADLLGVRTVQVVAAAFVTAAPFMGWFMPFASGIEFAPARTPVWQWLVLYGHGVLACAVFLALAYRVPALRRQWALAFLFAVALTVLIVPEIVIVRDIYGLEYARANTMFKLSFRAQPMLVIAAAVTVAFALRLGRRGLFAGGVVALPLCALLAYAPHIAIAPSAIRSLDGLGFLGDERALVLSAAGLPLQPGEAIIEASGPAFGPTARVSAMTGQDAVVGWAAHQWLWRNDPVRPNRRAEDVRQFYTTPDAALRCAIAQRYRVRYVILGQVEREFYPDLNESGLRAIGVSVHDDAGGQIIAITHERCPA